MSHGSIRDLANAPELNGQRVHVTGIIKDRDGNIRYVGSVGERTIALRRKNVIFHFGSESRAFGFNPMEIMQEFGATQLTPVCALRMRYYHEPPTMEDVRLFWGPNVYTKQRQNLADDCNRGGRGYWARAGVMYQDGGRVHDGVVFTTGEHSNQTNDLTDYETESQPSPCLWWPCLITQEPGHINTKIVRCWEQNLRHSRPWWTPSPRCHEFHALDNEAEPWVLVEESTVVIEEVFDNAVTDAI
jgi:hypothetical protein